MMHEIDGEHWDIDILSSDSELRWLMSQIPEEVRADYLNRYVLFHAGFSYLMAPCSLQPLMPIEPDTHSSYLLWWPKFRPVDPHGNTSPRYSDLPDGYTGYLGGLMLNGELVEVFDTPLGLLSADSIQSATEHNEALSATEKPGDSWFNDRSLRANREVFRGLPKRIGSGVSRPTIVGFRLHHAA